MIGASPFRSRRFVDRRIQGRLMSRVGLYWLLYHVLLWQALLVYRYVQFRLPPAGGQMAGSFHEQVGQVALDYWPVLLCGLLTLPVVLFDMLSLSHRVAGPLVQLGEALRDLTEGRAVDPVTLRKGDLVTTFQREFNDYLTWLGQRSVGRHTNTENPPIAAGSQVQSAAALTAHPATQPGGEVVTTHGEVLVEILNRSDGSRSPHNGAVTVQSD